MKMIYIVGFGRSGSTLLDIMLGSDFRIFSSGELVNLIYAYLNGEYCSCGNKVDSCAFWSKAISEWRECNALEDKDMRRFALLDRKYSHPKSMKAWYCALFSPRKGNYSEYLVLLHSLLHAIQRNAGVDTITDSSKSPVRLLNIMKLEGIDGKIIHLVKHPYGIIQSLLKPLGVNIKKGVQGELRTKSSFRTALRWVIVNRFARFSSSKTGCYSVQLKYEELVLNPTDSLKNFVAGTTMKEPFRGTHICAGNRMRMLDEVYIQNNDLVPQRPNFIARIILSFYMKKAGY